MNVYTLTEKFEKSKLYMIIILRFETIQRKSVFRRVIKNEKEQKELETYRSDRSGGMCLCDSWSDSWNQADQQRKQQNIRCSDYRISSRSERDNPDTYNSERL